MGRRNTYSEHTKRPLNCLAFIAIPLVCFHWGASYYGTPLLAPYDVGRVLRAIGGASAILPPFSIVVVLLVLQVVHRERWRVQPKVLAGMLGESIFWLIPLIGINLITGKMFLHAPGTTATETVIQELLVSVGAGVYEEFVFRLMMIGLAMLLLVDGLDLPETAIATVTILASAALFSLYHFTGKGINWSDFPWYEFVFRTVAGVYLGGVFYYRGFGIAVAVHTFFNIYVFMAA
jgi:hypothetical protein